MKNKIKKVFKNRIFICILTALITGTISVCAITYFPSNQVTYDNKTSGLKSSDVQGAIDELYNTCSSAVQAGDYLYYAVNNFTGGGSPPSYTMADGSVIYRCNINGENCNQIVTVGGRKSINDMYITKQYIYYVETEYVAKGSRPPLHTIANGSSVNKCNLDGSGCSQIVIVSGSKGINSIYITKNHIYYVLTEYILAGSSYWYNIPYSATINECNLDGSDCLEMYSFSNYKNVDGLFIK